MCLCLKDTVSAQSCLNSSASLERPQDCMTMPPIRMTLPFIRLDTLLTEKVPSFYALHYLVISVERGADGDTGTALPKPLEILHGAGKLLRSFEMISVDCPLRQLSHQECTQNISDCGMSAYYATNNKGRGSLNRQPFHRKLWAIINYITDQGFPLWRCNNNACHFAKESTDVALAIYYHRIKSLHINQPLKMWPNVYTWAPERRGKCFDDIYHEEIKTDLRPILQKRTFRANEGS